MTRSVLLWALLISAVVSYGQTEVESTIKNVQVYTRGAEVNRTASHSLKSGRNELKLTGLSANLDPNTIQIGGAGFTILSVRHELDYITNQNAPERTQALLTSRKALEDSIDLIDLELSILSKEAELLNRNMTLVGKEGIDNNDFQNAVKFFSDRYQQIIRQQFAQSLVKEELKTRIVVINTQLESESGREKKASSNIYLVLNAENSFKADLGISYAIKEAGWFPAYDIRATNINAPLSLTYKARVFQNSGIDWKNVKLRISSGDLESSGTAPQLEPYYLGAYRFSADKNGLIDRVSGRVLDETGQPLPQTTVLVKGTTIGVPADANGYFSLPLPSGNNTLIFRFLGYVTQEVPVNQSVINVNMQPDAQELSEVVVSGVSGTSNTLQGRAAGVQIQVRGQSSLRRRSDKLSFVSRPLDYEQINYQTTFVYDIDLPYSIPSTGKPEVVDIKTELLDVDFQYRTAPKARESAYLVASIADWQKLNLLDGESNLYFQNNFVGQSLIDTKVGVDTLQVSLGKDEGIIVNRQRKRDFEQQRFFSNKKRDERHYEITIVNTKQEAITVEVQDQIPLAVRDNIKVNVLEISQAQLDEKTGLLSWILKLKPGEKRVLQVRYSVDHPKSGNLEVN